MKNPEIVAQQGFLTQTASLPLTTVFTPLFDGVFRITAYMVFTTPEFEGTGAGMAASLQWVDELKAETSQIIGTGDPLGWGQGEIVIHAKGGQAIQVASLYNPLAISPYNLYITVIHE
jgi:hypothetical protein